METQRRLAHREASARKAAVGLGWFSIALGLAELAFAGPIARALGMRGQEGLIRLYGAREVATGLGIVAAKDPEPWIWGRVAGDALDITTLAANVPDNPKAGNVALALGAVAGATALDVYTAQTLHHVRQGLLAPVHDYTNRSGFPMGMDRVRGAALRDFEVPHDMRTPEGMRPILH